MKGSEGRKKLENSGSNLNHLDQSSRGSNWLQLHDHGLEAVRVILDCKAGNPQLEILLVLEEIRLLKFLSEAWVCQDQDVCQEFVEHWEYQSRTTTVHGTKIDLSLTNFLDVCGFERQWSIKPLDRPTLTSSATTTRCTSLFQVQGDNWRSAPISSCKDDLVRNLLLLLSKTLWFPCFKHPSRAPKELIYLVIESLDDVELNWPKCVYSNFLDELKRLQIQRRRLCDQIRTQSGPLMYFLYTHAKSRRASFSEIVQYHKKDSVPQVQRTEKTIILDRSSEEPVKHDKVAVTKFKSDDPFGVVPTDSTEEAPKVPSLTPPFPRTWPNKRRRTMCEESLGVTVTAPNDDDVPFTSSTVLEPTTRKEDLQVLRTRMTVEALENQTAQKNEEILRLQFAEIDSRLKAEKMERLYLEEQKHVEECLKLHFEAVESGEEVEYLKAKVNALEEEKRELEKKESFLELQLADMRRRWETAVAKADLAEIQAAEKSCLLLRMLNPTGM